MQIKSTKIRRTNSTLRWLASIFKKTHPESLKQTEVFMSIFLKFKLKKTIKNGQYVVEPCLNNGHLACQISG